VEIITLNDWGISPYNEVIDSRDIAERIKKLQDTKENVELKEWEEDELNALVALSEEASGYSDDWEYGSTLIRDSYFKEYAQDLAYECGAISNDISWPLHCIDWDQAAYELKMDYTEVEYAGYAYWIR